jgi:glycosyltransferase involved in cell wall biosynthesis
LSSKLDRRVLVVLGLYRPDLELLSRQLGSLLAQTHQSIEIFVSADGPPDQDVRDAIGRFADGLIHFLEHDTRVGVHANFGRGLRAALDASRTNTDLFAFCDQDDFWHPEKLTRQVEVLAAPEISLCHCDARIVSRDGNLLRPSLLEHERRLRTASFADLLAMNSVTGMTAVFRRDVAEAAASFPMSRCRFILHDHWTALVASLLGRIHFIDSPLVDYTQHAANVMGARDWAGSMPRALSPSRRRAYLRKCYRQFLWRRRALDELRRSVGDRPAARESLFAAPVRALFDCDAGQASGLSQSLSHRLRGEWRQADQIWRIWRGKTLYCASAAEARSRLRPQDIREV